MSMQKFRIIYEYDISTKNSNYTRHTKSKMKTQEMQIIVMEPGGDMQSISEQHRKQFYNKVTK